ncbi:MAG: aminotransferase class I/II-fold pyridoxal phosphate-dependent enzyme, partial [Bacillota bacterium]|nr:aminotransferase class I/II-fold pyridoxal phosphate-dependent enzyme [Bacillota bacterium]
ARYFKGKMHAAGFDTGKSETPITPVMIGDAAKASQLSRELFEAGVYAQSISFPTVARGKARIRAMISAVHNREDLDFAVEHFTVVGRRLGLV